MNGIKNYFRARSVTSLLFLFFLTAYSLHLITGYSSQYYSRAFRVTDENIFEGISSKVVVRSVVKDGASDRAGMIPGDTIISINGQTFKNAFEADHILRNAEAGKLMNYQIIRGDRQRTLFVRAALQKFHLNSFFGLVVGILIVLAGLVLAFLRPEIKTIRALATALVFFGAYLMIFLVGRKVNNLGSMIIMYNGVCVAFPLFIYLGLQFPYQKNDIWEKKKIQFKILAGLAFGLYFLALINWLFYNVIFIYSFAGLYSKPTVLLFLIVFTLYILFFFYLLILLLFSKKMVQPEAKAVSIGWRIFFSGLLLQMVLSSFVEQNKLGVLFLLFLAAPAGYYYVIIKEQLHGIYYYVKRTVLYTLSLILIYILFGLMFLFALNQLSGIPLNDLGIKVGFTSIEIGKAIDSAFSERPIFIIFGVLLFIGFAFLVRKTKMFIDQYFSKQEYNYKETLRDFSSIMSAHLSKHELYENVTNYLQTVLRIKSIAIYSLKNNRFILENKRDAHFLHTFEFIQEKELYRYIFSPTEKYFFVPIKSNDVITGCLLLGEKRSEEIINQTDLELIRVLADQTAIAFENNRLIDEELKNIQLKRDLELARKIQFNLLPHSAPHSDALDVVGYYQPAKEIGGDYYDYFTTVSQGSGETDSVLIVVGDVSGKGISASLYMSRFQGVMRSLFYSGVQTPKKLFWKMNQLIRDEIERNAFVTCAGVLFKTEEKKFTFSRAGHHGMLWYRTSKNSIELLEPKGMGLGLIGNNVFAPSLEEISDYYENNDVFLLYSDGVTEAMNAHHEEFGEERIKNVFKQHDVQSSEQIKSGILNELHTFLNGEIAHDDITLVVIKATL